MENAVEPPPLSCIGAEALQHINLTKACSEHVCGNYIDAQSVRKPCMPGRSTRRYRTPPAGPSPRPSSHVVSHVMRANKSSGTKPELTLARRLHRGLSRSSLPGSPDLVYRKEKVAVFVQGCWWHRCPRENFPLPRTHKSYWSRKFERNVERDRTNRLELESAGWQVLEVWEHEIKEDLDAAARKVRTALARSPSNTAG